MMDRFQPSNDQLAYSSPTLIRRQSSVTAAREFASNRWNRVAAALIVLMSCCLMQLPFAAAQNAPDGTIELSGGSVAAGIGYAWGNGTLVYAGEKHSFKISGLSIVHVGVSSYTASGSVYGMTKLSDFNGVYTAVSAGAAVAGGASGIAMKNSNGVVIQMVTTAVGLNFSLGPSGVTITLE